MENHFHYLNQNQLRIKRELKTNRTKFFHLLVSWNTNQQLLRFPISSLLSSVAMIPHIQSALHIHKVGWNLWMQSPHTEGWLKGTWASSDFGTLGAPEPIPLGYWGMTVKHSVPLRGSLFPFLSSCYSIFYKVSQPLVFPSPLFILNRQERPSVSGFH